MKKGFIILLALVLLFTAGCSAKTEQPVQTTVPETNIPTTEVPETTVPETTVPMPKLETGTVQGDKIPAILCLLKKGDIVEATGYADETHAKVMIDNAVGTVETQLLRFAGETAYESWTAYARYNTALYNSYRLTGEAAKTLKTNTELTILDELEDCYLVQAGEDTGYIAKAQASKWRITSSPETNDGSSGGQDGGNISLTSAEETMGQIVLLTEVTRTGSAEIRADGGAVVLKYFNLGDTVQIVVEEGSAPELPGYATILEDGVYAYIPTAWVQKTGDEEFESWDGFAGYDCYLYDNYEMRGEPLKQISVNKTITVLWQAGDVTLVLVDDTLGYVSTQTVRTTRVPTQHTQEGGGGSEWTPPAM